MKLLPFIACMILASCYAAPSKKPDPEIVINDNLFNEDFVFYTGKHDIVRIFVPFNQFNFKNNNVDSSSSSEETEHAILTLFFVEGDVTNDKVTYQGLYIFKNGKATKLLNNGRDATATHTNVIYFGAADGIYKYSETSNTATKHGTVTDSIIQLAHNNKTNNIYYLTEDHEVYKLNEDATSSVKVSALKDVQEIVFGFEGNMYYYDSDKKFYVVDIELKGVPKVITGLPEQVNKTVLISPFYGLEDGALLLVDGTWVYGLESKGTAEKSPIKIEVAITAQAPQATLIQFYAKDKKLYEFNIIVIMLTSIFQELRKILNEYENVISSVKKASF